jgi:hypothetical protein
MIGQQELGPQLSACGMDAACSMWRSAMPLGGDPGLLSIESRKLRRAGEL